MRERKRTKQMRKRREESRAVISLYLLVRFYWAARHRIASHRIVSRTESQSPLQKQTCGSPGAASAPASSISMASRLGSGVNCGGVASGALRGSARTNGGSAGD